MDDIKPRSSSLLGRFKRKPEVQAPEGKREKEEKVQEEKTPKAKGGNFSNLLLRVSLQEKVLFAKHLSVALKSGMTLQSGLGMIKDQTKSGTFKKILGSLIHDTNNGMALGVSMDRYRSVFGDLFINIVGVGENSGTLIENLQYLSVELTKKKALHSKVRGAMIYPIIILVATIGIVSALMIGIFPKILPVFANLKIELPLTTRALIAISKFATEYTFWIAGGVFFLVIALWISSHYKFFKYGWHHLIVKLPIIGKISKKVNAANLTRVLGLLLTSGVQIIEAVEITADAMDNYVYKRELRAAGERLRRGEFFSKYLKEKPKLFPPILTNMIEVGENTGNLSENLAYLSEYYEGEVDDVLKNLSSIIEPILLLLMGLIVGFIAISVITPIYRISQTLTL
ncbi:MAG: type II secretion system F family protein [Candidatus Harrisonbacteria bacterium]|nr:type II secretion system F family protein [Candidatus Harrisonbacteria bacterium]